LPLLIYQARVPVGRTILELPAGMLDDDDGDLVGTPAREVQCSILLSEILISYCICSVSSFDLFEQGVAWWQG